MIVAAPGHTSATREVPAAVPSDDHSSLSRAPSVAVKYSRPPITAHEAPPSSGRYDVPYAWTSATRYVPASVPSLDQSPTPAFLAVAAKKTRPPIATIGCGREYPGPA